MELPRKGRRSRGACYQQMWGHIAGPTYSTLLQHLIHTPQTSPRVDARGVCLDTSHLVRRGMTPIDMQLRRNLLRIRQARTRRTCPTHRGGRAKVRLIRTILGRGDRKPPPDAFGCCVGVSHSEQDTDCVEPFPNKPRSSAKATDLRTHWPVPSTVPQTAGRRKHYENGQLPSQRFQRSPTK